jgi:Tfp pilus assembly protein PilV
MRNQGFTLVEVLIAAVVVTCGLVAVASMFSFAVRANVNNRQMAVATALLYDKMEQFKSTPLDNPLWKNPDGFDYVTQETTYVRVWQVSSSIPQSVTIIVYAENALTRRHTELIRATALASSTF